MAVRYQLPTGKTVILKDEDFFDLSDEDLQKKIQEMIANDMGIEVDNPFIKLRLKEFDPLQTPDFEDIEQIPEEEILKIKNEFNGEED